MKNKVLVRSLVFSLAVVISALFTGLTPLQAASFSGIRDYPCSRIMNLNEGEVLFKQFSTEFSNDPQLATEMMKASQVHQWPAKLMREVYTKFKAVYGDPIARLLTQNSAQVDWDAKDIDALYQDLLKNSHPALVAAQLNRAGSMVDWAARDISDAYNGLPGSYSEVIRAPLAQPAILLDWAPKDIDKIYQEFFKLGYSGELAAKLTKVAALVDWLTKDVNDVYADFLTRVSPDEALELTQVAVITEAKNMNVDAEKLYNLLREKFPRDVALAMLKTISGVGILVE